MAIDPSLSNNIDELKDPTEAINYLSDIDKKTAEVQSIQQEQEQQQEQYVATQQDARDNPDGWGLKGLAKEAQSILTGGLQDTASSIATFPERTADMLSGEMQREKEETGVYRPDWSPFVDYENPIETL